MNRWEYVCKANVSNGQRCTRKCKIEVGYCYQHKMDEIDYINNKLVRDISDLNREMVDLNKRLGLIKLVYQGQNKKNKPFRKKKFKTTILMSILNYLCIFLLSALLLTIFLINFKI